MFKHLSFILLLSGLLFATDYNSTSTISTERLLHLTLIGDNNASRELGLRLIYKEEECEKGISFLIIAAESNPLAVLDLANLFKDGKCISPSEEKYNKYINIYNERISK